MTDSRDRLLQQALDPDAPDDARRAAEAALADDPAGARRLAEHRAVWDALGELDTPLSDVSPEHFASEVGRRAQREERRARRFRLVRGASPALAATLLVVVGLAWFGHRAWVTRDDQLVRFLHLVEHAELADSRGVALDLRSEVEIRRAFEGELLDR